MTKKKILFGLLGIVLACAFVFTTCELAGSKTDIVDAATPEWDLLSGGEPSGGSYEPNQLIRLTANAMVSDKGDITFQWYSLEPEYIDPTGTAIEEDGTSDILELKLPNEGVYLFYVVITNTNTKVNGRQTATLTSNIVVITVESSTAVVKYPVIKQQPANDTKQSGDVELKIEAGNANNDHGILTYQWYSVNGTGNKDGSKIDGATDATSIINLSAPGDYNYFCVVTNNESEPDGADESGEAIYKIKENGQTKSISSQVATITIIAEMEPNAYIAINPNRKYQYVRGFGGMGDSFNDLAVMKNTGEYETLFNPDTGLGLNMLRIMIMPENPVDNTDVKKTNDYYVNGAGGYPLYYEGVKIVNKYNGYVLASPWSPPPEWKTNNSKNGGGSLKLANYHDYAGYLRDFCQDMLDHGAPIYAISIQNEPNFTASYDGCEWTPEEMREFFLEEGHFTTVPSAIKGYGGGKEIPSVLTMNGESANHPDINDKALDNPTSRAAIDVLGRHTYGDALLRYGKALDVEPKKEVWMTEHNINSGNATAYPNDSTWNYVWLFLNDVDVSIRQNDESAFIWWYIRRFYSAIGDGTYGTSEGVVYPRGYGLSHYAKYGKEMWRCGISVTGTTADGKAISASNVNPAGLSRTTTHVRVTGFVSEDGNTISLVMYTPTNTSGRDGVDMGTVKIDLPKGFVASKAEAVRSTAVAKMKKETVMLSNDKTSANIMLPPSTILSVRFTK